MLGSNLLEQALKDYNGQAYWLSANIHSFLDKESSFPAWLNISAGYSAEGVISGKANEEIADNLPHFERYRQFFISPDIDFTRIKTRSRFLKKAFFVLNIFKFPAPAIEFSKNKSYFRPLYF